MPETKWTPGPWFFEPARPFDIHHQYGYIYSIQPNGEREAIANTGHVASNLNGPMMAAAPDLYQALEDCLMQLQFIAEEYQLQEICERARVALAKARGEQPDAH